MPPLPTRGQLPISRVTGQVELAEYRPADLSGNRVNRAPATLAAVDDYASSLRVWPDAVSFG